MWHGTWHLSLARLMHCDALQTDCLRQLVSTAVTGVVEPKSRNDVTVEPGGFHEVSMESIHACGLD